MTSSVRFQDWIFQNEGSAFEAEVVWNGSVYFISYTPVRAGIYNLSAVIFINDSSVHISNSPFKLFVQPSVNVSAWKSTANGEGLTLSTAGIRSYFTITTHDIYGGVTYSDSPRFGIFLPTHEPPLGFLLQTLESTASYAISYIPMVVGDHPLKICAPVGSGFDGEYYADPDFVTNIFNRIDNEIDFTWQQGRPGTDLSVEIRKPGLSFAVRWTGFVFTMLEQIHTFSIQLLGPDERVRLWLDESLMIDQVQLDFLSSKNSTEMLIFLTAVE